jgi:hypothetical protein
MNGALRLERLAHEASLEDLMWKLIFVIVIPCMMVWIAA